MVNKKLSIITVNYNNAAGLKATLDSVAAQTCHEFEHVIIDGGSTDASIDIIREYEKTITNHQSQITIIWSSEPDRGIYDAMNKGVEIASGKRVVNAFNRSELVEDKNKGVKKASGEYVYFLNSGDTLSSPIILQDIINSMDDSDFIIGRVNLVKCGSVVGQTPLLSEVDMSLYNMYLHGINHQSALIKKELLKQTPYDTSVKMGADWKFFVQTIVLGNASTKFENKIFANYDVSGVSSNSDAVRKERESILASFVPERIARDYLAIAPHYYEVVRIQWLLQHPFWYKLYRGITTLGRKLTTDN